MIERHTFSRELRLPVSGEYYLQLPAETGGEPLPLLLFLHGMHQADRLFELEAPPRIARDRGLPLIVVSPLCSEMRWEVDMLLGLLEEVLASNSVDQRRIYATGISIGGLATWELALRCPDLLAAIVTVCGAGQPWNAFRIAHIPTWAFHGALDEVVPSAVSGDMVDALRESHGQARLTIYSDAGHDAWSHAYSDPELWDWLLEQKTGARQALQLGAENLGRRGAP